MELLTSSERAFLATFTSCMRPAIIGYRLEPTLTHTYLRLYYYYHCEEAPYELRRECLPAFPSSLGYYSHLEVGKYYSLQQLDLAVGA